MDAARSMGDRYRTARLSAASGNTLLGTQEGAAEVIGVSTDTVSRWECDESIPTNFNAKKMAIAYHAPELMDNYCAFVCPLGDGRVREISPRPVEQLTIRLHNTSLNLQADVLELMTMAEDGTIDEGERARYNAIISRLDDLSHVIRTLKITVEKQTGMKGGIPR